MGLKTVDNFEELELNPDLLRGIYGTSYPTQPSVFKNHPSFNKRALSPSSAKETPSPKHSPEQAKLQLFQLVSSNALTLSLQNVKQSCSLLLENLHNK